MASGRVQPGFIADKRELDEPMAGYPLARASRPDGAWVYTLYQGPEHAFVHALAAAEGYALCIDLPGGAPRRDAASYWGLALAGDTVYAANAALRRRRRAERAGRRGRPRRAAARGAAASRARTLSRAARRARGRRPDAVRDRTARARPPSTPLSLRARDRLAADRSLAGIAVSPDAKRLYAVDAATRAVLALDARTGRRLGAVDGATGAVSLLGVVRARTSARRRPAGPGGVRPILSNPGLMATRSSSRSSTDCCSRPPSACWPAAR